MCSYAHSITLNCKSDKGQGNILSEHLGKALTDEHNEGVNKLSIPILNPTNVIFSDTFFYQ